MGQARVLLGVIAAAHGVKGEAKVKTFTSAVENLSVYGPLTTEDGRTLSIVSVRATKDGEAVVRFEGVSDRNAVDALKGQLLHVARSALPEPEKDEFYQADLIGLRVEDRNGNSLGTVAGLHNFGGGDVMEIKSANGETFFIPFTNATVPLVDVQSGRIVADPPRYVEDEN